MSESWRGGSTTRWRAFRAAILRRDHYLCTIRGPGCLRVAPLSGGHVDHIIPLSAGGPKFDPSNVRAACERCNRGRPMHVLSEPEPRSVSNW